MKIRFCAALLLAAFCATAFTGCAAAGALNQPQALPEITISTEPLPRNATPVPSSADAPVPTPAATPAATGPSHTLPASTKAAALLTKEDAEKIALEHAGFTADQVQRLRTELDHERGKAEYEVDFHVDRWEYDYDIDAETGAVIRWDKDWDD